MDEGRTIHYAMYLETVSEMVDLEGMICII